MKKNLLKFIQMFSVIILFPGVAFAASGTGISGVITRIEEVLRSILPVIISLGVIYFVWGIVQYFIADGEEAKKTGKDRIIYGIIGLAVIISVWGLVNIIKTTFFGTESFSAPTLEPLTGPSSACNIETTQKRFQDYIGYVTCTLNNSIIPLIFALAVVMFAWGTVKFFIINADEEAKRTEGKQFMIWGIIALAVMLSVWGLVNILGVTFDIGDTSVLPQVKPNK